jgi:hypothetical protein
MIKTLKFVPELVPLVLNGSKNSTWRLFDEKNLSKDEELILIDKSNLKEFAKAKIIEVKELPLKNLTTEDRKGHETFSSDQEMYATYSGYYNQKVEGNTPIKIIRFKLI